MTKSHGWADLGRMRLPGFPPEDAPRAYSKGSCRVLVDQEPRRDGGPKLWHLSISCESRYPTWDEIKDARYALLPLRPTFAMLLPPPIECVNVHPRHKGESNDITLLGREE